MTTTDPRAAGDPAGAPSAAATVQPVRGAHEDTAWLDLTRIIAITAVVLVHVVAPVVTGRWAVEGTPGWWTGNVLDSALRWCAPVFVMISSAGYFVAGWVLHDIVLTPHRVRVSVVTFVASVTATAALVGIVTVPAGWGAPGRYLYVYPLQARWRLPDAPVALVATTMVHLVVTIAISVAVTWLLRRMPYVRAAVG